LKQLGCNNFKFAKLHELNIKHAFKIDETWVVEEQQKINRITDPNHIGIY
jgi:hypothetical protein